MMLRITGGLTIVGLFWAAPACSQIPASRPAASEITAALLAQGHASGWTSYVDFQGCPQDDPVGAAVLAELSSSALPQRLKADLVIVWADEYDGCDYGPLISWFEPTALALAGTANGPPGLPGRLPSTIGPRLHGLAVQIASDPDSHPLSRTELASDLLLRAGPIDQEDLYLDFLQQPAFPAEWVSGWSAFFLQENGGNHLVAVTAVSAAIDDATMSTFMGILGTALSTGTIATDDPALDPFFDSLDGRSGLVSTTEMLRSLALSHTVAAATSDTYLKQGTPNNNQGTEDILRIRQSGKNRALVQVSDADLASVTGTIASAYLEFDIVFNGNNWGTEGRTVDAHRMIVPWTHFGATWNCADDIDPSDSGPDCDAAGWEMRTLEPSPYDPTPSGTLLVTKDMLGTYSIDVTADVQAMIDGQLPNYGWIIRKTNEGQAGHIQLASSETGAGPRLVIVY
jgi:hypothetical protein